MGGPVGSACGGVGEGGRFPRRSSDPAAWAGFRRDEWSCGECHEAGPFRARTDGDTTGALH